MAAVPREFPNSPAGAFCHGSKVAFQPPVLPRKENDSEIRRYYRSSGADNLELDSKGFDQPVLLLEGDEFFVSHDGISRTMYKLRNCPVCCQMEEGIGGTEFMVEELYNLASARKTFILRHLPPVRTAPTLCGQIMTPELLGEADHGTVLGKAAQGVAKMGSVLDKIEIQEIDQGIFGSAGTGSATWETSVCMALFFGLNPDLLRGDVLELGSGLGLGSILTKRTCGRNSQMKSLTLTDNNDQVLNQCRENMKGEVATCKVGKLDWNDFVEARNTKNVRTYDTLIGSDICYTYPDIVALSETVVSLLKKDGKAKLHLFGPLNRGALHTLVRELKAVKKMIVSIDCIEMERYRLRPVKGHDHDEKYEGSQERSSDLNEGLQSLGHEEIYSEVPYASKNVAKNLHITASHDETLSDPGVACEERESITDLD